MKRNEIFMKLNAIFCDVFDDNEITINDCTTSEDISGWDSLAHINLINAIEQEFGMRFRMNQIVSMKNVGEMVDIIMEALK